MQRYTHETRKLNLTKPN